ncbi:transposase [Streptomyces sp. MCAF7]
MNSGSRPPRRCRRFAVRPQGGGTAPCDERAVFTAVVYALTSGCAWRHLPPTFGTSPATAHRRSTVWTEAPQAAHPRHTRRPVPPGTTAAPTRQTPRGQGVLLRRTPGLAARARARRAHRAARHRVRRTPRWTVWSGRRVRESSRAFGAERPAAGKGGGDRGIVAVQPEEPSPTSGRRTGGGRRWIAAWSGGCRSGWGPPPTCS